MTRSLQPIEPMDGHRVRMYSCGPTVYRFAHVGNLRTFLLPDLDPRASSSTTGSTSSTSRTSPTSATSATTSSTGARTGCSSPAGLERESTAEIADAYEAAFHADAAAMNLLPAHVFPRATEHIRRDGRPGRAARGFGARLRDRGGNVYYAVASFPGYGRLSGNTLDALRAGHRGEVEADKRDPADFALWKAAGPGRILAGRHAGATASPAGTSSAPRWRCATSASVRRPHRRR